MMMNLILEPTREFCLSFDTKNIKQPSVFAATANPPLQITSRRVPAQITCHYYHHHRFLSIAMGQSQPKKLCAPQKVSTHQIGNSTVLRCDLRACDTETLAV